MLLNNAEAPKAVLLLPVVLSQSANPLGSGVVVTRGIARSLLRQ
jgi:hypothetical protein